MSCPVSLNTACNAHLEGCLLALDDAETIHLLATLLIKPLDFHGGVLDRLLVFGGANDVLKILKKTVLMLVLSLGLHERDGFDLALEDEETVVVEVDPLCLEQSNDLLAAAVGAVDRVLGGVVAECRPRNDNLGFGNEEKVIDARLEVSIDPYPR